MVYVVNGVLASGVDIVLEKEFDGFALQVMEIHPLMLLIQTLSMNLQTFSPTFHNPSTSQTRVSYVATNIDQSPPQEMSIQHMEDLKQKYLGNVKLRLNTIPLNEIISQIPMSIAIIPILPIVEPEDSLIMGNEELSTISEKESDEVIKSSVEDFVPILSESEDTSGSDSECGLPSYDNFSPINIPGGEILLEDIENKDSSVSNIEEPALLVTPLFDANEDEYIDTSTDIKDGYHDSEGDIIYLESLLMNDTIPSLPPEVFLNHDPRSLSDINDLKITVKVFEPGIPKKFFSPTYVSLPFEDCHYLFFTYVIRIFLPYFTYPVNSPFLLPSGSEDTIFDPDIFAFHFSSLESVASPRSGTFISFNVYPNILNESPMEICSSTRFNPNIMMMWGESS
nr:hypothetical protein [Tanacetum cinerariifolium]